MSIRKLRVQIETSKQRISGVLQLPTEGYRSRVTDFLNGHDTGFIAMTDAEIISLDGAGAEARDYVAVGVRHIETLVELEDLGTMAEESDGDARGYYSTPSAPPPAVRP